MIHVRFSIFPKNFERAMVVHVVRLLQKSTWLNDRDQFMHPRTALSREFVTDAELWSLFSLSNQTVSLLKMEYEDKMYRMANNLYPIGAENQGNIVAEGGSAARNASIRPISRQFGCQNRNYRCKVRQF